MDLLFFIFLINTSNPIADSTIPDTARITFDFKDADVRDVMRAIGVQLGTNIIVSKNIEGTITVHLEKVLIEEGLRIMLEANGFSLEKKENYYLVTKPDKDRRKIINVENDRLTLDVKNIPADELLRDIAHCSKLNIIADQTATANISGILNDVPLERGLSSLLSANGLLLKKSAGIYEVTAAGGQPGRRKGLSVIIDEDKNINIDVSDADIGDILDELSVQAGLNIIRYGEVSGTVNAKMENIPLEKALSLLFQGTAFTFRKSDEIYLVGSKSLDSPAAAALASSRLIPLKYIKADLVPAFLPQTIPQGNVKVIKEQNAILVLGTDDLINQCDGFIKTIDLPSPQVLIEAVIVEYSKATSRELGLRGLFARADTTRRLFPQFNFSASGDDMNRVLDRIGEYFNITSLGRLPSDFWLMVDALETRGKARVKARPRIATLNGNEASIDVGWVRYYRTTTGTPEQPIYQLHSIDAGIKLKIIPWVSATGEITTVIQTEVSNLKSLGPEGLPEIARRSANTTLNIKNGETIALAGLIQTASIVSRESIPILGSIPLLGKLFSRTTASQEETELVIYITPELLD